MGAEEKGDNGIGKKAKDNNSGLCSFSYSYDGTIGRNNYHYDIKKEDGITVFRYETMLHDEYGEMNMHIDDSVLSGLNDIYLSCRIAEWDGYSKYNPHISDGKGFSVNFRFNDGGSVSAHGSNAFPDRYNVFFDKMNALLGPLCKKMVEDARQKKIDAGITGKLVMFMVNYIQHGDSGSDRYSFLISNQDIRDCNYDITVESKSGEFFPAGNCREYKAVPDEYIPMAEVDALIRKYELIKWHGFEGAHPDNNNREWYQINLSFDDKSRIDARGTLYPEHYEDFRRDFLQLMAKTAEKIKKL